MTVSEELADLRAGYPGCHAVVFADLSTGMVLASSTAEKTAQEQLDALCEAAHGCLMGRDATDFTAGLLSDVGAHPVAVWQAAAGGIRCFVKLAEPAGEALCCVADGNIDPDALCRDATALLSRIAVEE